MVAVGGAGDVKPNRQFSDFILGGLWPETSPGPWTGAASAQRTFAQTSRGRREDVGASASAILADNDGAMIEAMHVTYQGDSKAVEAQSDLFTVHGRLNRRMRRIVKNARLQMDAIDREAHEAIQKIIDIRRWESFGGWAVLSMIWAVLAQAKNGCVGSVCGGSGEHWVRRPRESNQQLCHRQAAKQVRLCKPSPTARTEMAMYSWRTMRSRETSPDPVPRAPGRIDSANQASGSQTRRVKAARAVASRYSRDSREATPGPRTAARQGGVRDRMI